MSPEIQVRLQSIPTKIIVFSLLYRTWQTVHLLAERIPAIYIARAFPNWTIGSKKKRHRLPADYVSINPGLSCTGVGCGALSRSQKCDTTGGTFRWLSMRAQNGRACTSTMENLLWAGRSGSTGKTVGWKVLEIQHGSRTIGLFHSYTEILHQSQNFCVWVE